MRDKKTLMVVFGEVVRELRTKRKMSQETLADLAQLTDRSHVSDIERAEKAPVLNTIFAIAYALNIPASELLALVEAKLKSQSKT